MTQNLHANSCTFTSIPSHDQSRLRLHNQLIIAILFCLFLELATQAASNQAFMTWPKVTHQRFQKQVPSGKVKGGTRFIKLFFIWMSF